MAAMTEAMRVVIFDAEASDREAIRDVLGEAGFACACGSGGEEALELAEEDAAGAVVLGIQSGPDDGLEILKVLRERRPGLPVIAIASHTEQERVLLALRLGAFDYLAKPVHDEELCLAVKRALDHYATATRARRLRQRLQTLESRLASLVGLARGAGADAEGEVRAGLADAVADVLGASKTSLMLLDDEGKELRVVAATGRKLALEEFDPVRVGEGAAGRALSESVLVRGSDDRLEERRGAFGHQYESSSFAIAPLAAGVHKLGVLCAADPAAGTGFDDEDAALLRILALQATLLLQPEGGGEVAGVAEAALGAGDPDAELARSVCDAVTAEVEPHRLVQAALRPVARALGAAPVSLYLLDAEGEALVREGECDGERRSDRERIGLGAGLTGTVVETGRLVAAGEPQSDPRFDADVDTPQDGRAGPLLCLPLHFRGKILGVFRAFPQQASAVSARTGEILAAALSAAVRNVLLYRSLVETIEEVARARRAERERTS
jgi:FixJ family two-component response regulator